MAPKFILAGALCLLCAASPASAAFDPFSQGPLADFLNLFSQPAVPRQVVPWNRGYGPGTVVISTTQRRLYYVLGNGQAIQYGVGVGRQGFTWAGTKTVSMKREWPDWRPPPQMLRRRPDLPRYMPGGMENPLGARALYLGSSLYPHPRLKRARDDRRGGFIRLHQDDESRCDGPLRSRQGRNKGRRA